MRKTGATMHDLIELGHNQPASTALKIAETRGLKTRSEKPKDGGLTRYYATGTPTATMRKAPAKKVAKKVAKKAAPKRAKKVSKPAAAVDTGATASASPLN
jgi:hypothetical protein